MLESAGNTALVVAILAVLALVVLDLVPDQEPALFLVYAHRGPATASDEVEQPAD